MSKTKIISLTAAAVVCVALLISLLSFTGLQAPKEEVIVSAAISLKEAFTQIAQQFEKSHPDAKIVFNFGASGELAKQIEEGAPADVFASAAVDKMDQLVGKGLVDSSTVKPFIKNRLVVIAPPSKTIRSFEDLSGVQRLAMADPKTVPAGKYAQQALTRAHLYEALQTQHKFVFGENVRQVLTYVEGGDVDAGIVYATDAAISKGVVVCFAVPETYTEPIVYPIGQIKTSLHNKFGQEFINLVISPFGREVLMKKGFIP